MWKPGFYLILFKEQWSSEWVSGSSLLKTVINNNRTLSCPHLILGKWVVSTSSSQYFAPCFCVIQDIFIFIVHNKKSSIKKEPNQKSTKTLPITLASTNWTCLGWKEPWRLKEASGLFWYWKRCPMKPREGSVHVPSKREGWDSMCCAMCISVVQEGPSNPISHPSYHSPLSEL